MVQANVILSGRVQGVGYRAWTQKTARVLSLSGWVRNLADGTVQARFVGPRATIEQMLSRCAEGPTHAAVDRIETAWGTPEPLSGFEILDDGPRQTALKA